MKAINYIFAALLMVLLTGCPADTPDSVELSDGQSAVVTLPYTTTSSTINFEAEADWFVTVTDADGQFIDWLHLDQTSGSAGSVNLNISMDENYSGEPRTARIVITCMDHSVTVIVCQLAEGENPDDGDGNEDDNEGDSPIQRLPQIDIAYSGINHTDMSEEDGRMSIVFDSWENLRPSRIIVNTKYEEDGQKGMVEQNFHYTYEDNGNIVNVKVEITKEGTVIDMAEYQITMENGRAIQGWSRYDGFTRNWSFDYDTSGHLVKSHTGIGTATFNWTGSDLTSIVDPYGTNMQIRYNENCINSNAYNFDPNWLIAPTMTSALSDDAFIFAMFKMFGRSSRYIVSEITCEDSGDYYTIDYDQCDENMIKCHVSDYHNDEVVETSTYIIRF